MRLGPKALELGPLEELGPQDAPNYDDPNGAKCVVAVGETGLWTFVVEPNIDDFFKDGAISFKHPTDDGCFPEDIDRPPGVYEATTAFKYWPGSYEYPDDGDWELGLIIGRPLYIHGERWTQRWFRKLRRMAHAVGLTNLTDEEVAKL